MCLALDLLDVGIYHSQIGACGCASPAQEIQPPLQRGRNPVGVLLYLIQAQPFDDHARATIAFGNQLSGGVVSQQHNIYSRLEQDGDDIALKKVKNS